MKHRLARLEARAVKTAAADETVVTVTCEGDTMGKMTRVIRIARTVEGVSK